MTNRLKVILIYGIKRILCELEKDNNITLKHLYYEVIRLTHVEPHHKLLYRGKTLYKPEDFCSQVMELELAQFGIKDGDEIMVIGKRDVDEEEQGTDYSFTYKDKDNYASEVEDTSGISDHSISQWYKHISLPELDRNNVIEEVKEFESPMMANQDIPSISGKSADFAVLTEQKQEILGASPQFHQQESVSRDVYANPEYNYTQTTSSIPVDPNGKQNKKGKQNILDSTTEASAAVELFNKFIERAMAPPMDLQTLKKNKRDLQGIHEGAMRQLERLDAMEAPPGEDAQDFRSRRRGVVGTLTSLLDSCEAVLEQLNAQIAEHEKTLNS